MYASDAGFAHAPVPGNASRFHRRPRFAWMYHPAMRWLAITLALGACNAHFGGPGGAGDTDGPPGSSIDAPPGSVIDGPPGSVPDGAAAAGGLFSHPMPWSTDVYGQPASSQSSTIINGLVAAGGWGTSGFQMDLSITVQTATASTPYVAFTPTADFYTPDCDQVKMPMPVGGAVEGETGYACTGGGDCHLLVIDPIGRHLYEMWEANYVNGTLNGGCTADWNLDASYDPNLLRGKGCSSADAGGFPMTAMLPTTEEVASGHVDHALRFILPNPRIRKGIYVAPGTHSTNPTAGGAATPPYGVRFRLRPDYPLASLPSDGARTLAVALQHYGMFLADGGNVPMTLASDRFHAVTWASLGVDEQSLLALQPSDFEVVDYGTPVNYFADDNCYRTGL
jgi:serine/threonine-protein kinase